MLDGEVVVQLPDGAHRLPGAAGGSRRRQSRPRAGPRNRARRPPGAESAGRLRLLRVRPPLPRRLRPARRRPRRPQGPAAPPAVPSAAARAAASSTRSTSPGRGGVARAGLRARARRHGEQEGGQPLPARRAGRRVAQDQVPPSRSSSSVGTPTRPGPGSASGRCCWACARTAGCATWARWAPASTRGSCASWGSGCSG